MTGLISERELDFLLYELLDTEALLNRPRYAEHSRDVFDATLDAARRLAVDLFAPHAAKADEQEPSLAEGAVHVIPEVASAWKAFADAGFLRAHWDGHEGGVQLPEVVLRSAMALFFAANTATTGYPFLTIGAANLLRAFGTEEQKRRFLGALGDGSAAGTMALTEPGQGSSLGDIRTKAVPHPDGSYRLFGQKMFISGGDQNFTGNILHMVLARMPGAPAGARGISLFLVPKHLVNDDGSPGDRNDVAVAGLLHKMGWRGTTSTVLSFGEAEGAVGYLLGDAHRGLTHMFQMMNEARIGVGLIASSLAYRGFVESLAYARQRPQGRLPSAKDPFSPQVMLVQHADVRRMLLAQKAYAEAGLAMCLFASSLFEDQHTNLDPALRSDALRLLEVLTPVVKSWPSKYGCVSNEMAMQVLGGAGYTREYPLELLYRDQRLNPIHEGAEAIHGIDLLGRKVVMNEGASFRRFCDVVSTDIRESRKDATLRRCADALDDALGSLASATETLVAMQGTDPDLALSDATLYLDAFGCVTAAWMWLKQARVATIALARAPSDAGYYRGKLQAAHYYFNRELPTTMTKLAVLRSLDRVPFDMDDGWFQ